MYLNFFGLSKDPFKITPDPEFFFSGGNRGLRNHIEVDKDIDYHELGIRWAGFFVTVAMGCALTSMSPRAGRLWGTMTSPSPPPGSWGPDCDRPEDTIDAEIFEHWIEAS